MKNLAEVLEERGYKFKFTLHIDDIPKEASKLEKGEIFAVININESYGGGSDHLYNFYVKNP